MSSSAAPTGSSDRSDVLQQEAQGSDRILADVAVLLELGGISRRRQTPRPPTSCFGRRLRSADPRSCSARPRRQPATSSRSNSAGRSRPESGLLSPRTCCRSSRNAPQRSQPPKPEGWLEPWMLTVALEAAELPSTKRSVELASRVEPAMPAGVVTSSVHRRGIPILSICPSGCVPCGSWQFRQSSVTGRVLPEEGTTLVGVTAQAAVSFTET